jgi:hypothetical protein
MSLRQRQARRAVILRERMAAADWALSRMTVAVDYLRGACHHAREHVTG